jgi:DNA-binding MarR family transcriptional regulator
LRGNDPNGKEAQKMADRFERFSLAIFEISRSWHRLAGEELGKYGLKSAHATYLTTMARFPEGITAPRLGELCGKDKSDVSRMMSILEERGLAVKDGPGKNRYRGDIRLTEQGRQVAAQLRQRAALAVERAGRGLSDDDRATFYDALETIADNLRAMSRSGL